MGKAGSLRAGSRYDAPLPGWRVGLSSYALIFSFLFVTHVPLLRLPYFWDEAGYFIPAAYDLLTTGSLIPHTTLSNAHPPLVMLWLAFWWKFSAFTPAVTRTAMLMVASFALLGLWRLSCAVANRHVATATVLCTAVYPVFFAQSSMAQLDVAAAAFTLWGLAMYVERRPVWTLVFFSLAPLAKETALVTPIALLCWELLCAGFVPAAKAEALCLYRDLRHALKFLLCPVPLALWLAYHHSRTGYYLGNPEYLRYNVQATLTPLRIAIALLLRLWQLFGYLNLFVLVGAAAIAMLEIPLAEADGELRRRIAINVQLPFLAVIAANLVAESAVGGAVLARYMLPVVPLVILICVSTVRRRVRRWTWVIAGACAAFVVQLCVAPPYRIAPEDTLLYRDFVVKHKQMAEQLSARYFHSRILTAWPASDELTRPFLGYVKQPLDVVRIENFSCTELAKAAHAPGAFDVAFVFSTKWEPVHPLFATSRWFEQLQERFFDYHRDVGPEEAAAMLGGRVVAEENRDNEWVALIAMNEIEDAKTRQGSGSGRLPTSAVKLASHRYQRPLYLAQKQLSNR